MSGFPSLPLREVALLNPRLGEKLDANAFVSFVPMASLSAEDAKVTSVEQRPYAEVSKGYTPFKSGDVLVAKITPCFENGKISQVLLPETYGFGSTEFHVVRPLPNKSDARYLHHFLRLGTIRIEGERRMTGSGGQRRVPENFLAELSIPLPPVPEQRRIAAILDQADALRAKRREALAQLDKLTQAIFVEMFGDLESNVNGLPVTNLEDLCVRVTDGTHQSPKWEPDGIPFLFISNILNGEISYSTEKFISRETYHELTRRCAIDAGDILFTTVGSYGNTAVVSGEREFCFQRHIAHIKPNAEKLDSSFCAAMLESASVRRQIDKVARGVAQKTINLADLKALRVFYPPIEKQKSFTTKQGLVKSIKAIQAQSLREFDDLFVTLQHRAFRGEL
ncbi:putative Type I restriction-modification system (Specificity subunit) [Thiomonas arsenitoxydans]|uniref:Type I restriction-modification system (Specificity subunit) n=1 Tax=Thiomonas arsenitoxydans (strain DSM 22701 / CIP 110005 / 3As) TaxID=426114 RepID=D6CND5_THIA3|nr:restriction endonuclease subunit S [Thiomonas arsenitoxydans]CAZ90063.1 putative Type I restriction-modification system (Specificity subunit) [Thiomonas arsenitoxydans]CQR37121.1 putative Type I restriction-modification system (Specificity subunit) [Thiomonas arsenitoxydans]CQR38238.1 putative Type I restriction-modification system (Specificity subunit) [Thiomonas arsenitoxydans]CQR40369.1 putative Type I restriction-modification system (Specificity subunit) [Thiomonas arsenitoxydans]CQR404